MSPLRASQVDQETTDTYSRTWRTWGAPHARWTLQNKPRGMDEEAQAPQSLGSQRLPYHRLTIARVNRRLMCDLLFSSFDYPPKIY